ncbi:MAG: phytoene/squalene synthase family protein [Pseudomonadales bacterium]
MRLRNGSRSFYAASLILPQDMAACATALYAFCRDVDDAVDEEGRAEDAVEQLELRLQRVYAGRPEDRPEDRAFSQVVVRWDMSERHYEDEAALYAYCARVAATVGAMMSLVMGGRDPQTLARACDLGVAMQLSNVARDVGEDARMGRLYLPRQWFQDEGLDPDRWLARPQFSPELERILRRLLSRADAFYERSRGGIACLPRGCRPGMHAARLIYAEIGEEVRRRGHDSVSARAIVPNWRKGLLVFRAALAALRRDPLSAEPTVGDAQFRVDAVVQDRAPAAPGQGARVLSPAGHAKG